MNKEQLLEEIMDQYTELMFRIAYYYTKDIQVSEDIVQEIFVKFYHSSHYEERGNIKAYLSKMTINHCKDYLRSWSYRKIIVQKKLTQRHYSHKDDLIQKDETTMLDEAILALPLKKREAIIYFYLENMSIKEIAALLSVSENTVKSRLRSGKEMLKASLQHIEWEVLLHD